MSGVFSIRAQRQGEHPEIMQVTLLHLDSSKYNNFDKNADILHKIAKFLICSRKIYTKTPVVFRNNDKF